MGAEARKPYSDPQVEEVYLTALLSYAGPPKFAKLHALLAAGRLIFTRHCGTPLKPIRRGDPT